MPNHCEHYISGHIFVNDTLIDDEILIMKSIWKATDEGNLSLGLYNLKVIKHEFDGLMVHEVNSKASFWEAQFEGFLG